MKTLTVGELIEMLSKVPNDTPVYMDAEDGGLLLSINAQRYIPGSAVDKDIVVLEWRPISIDQDNLSWNSNPPEESSVV